MVEIRNFNNSDVKFIYDNWAENSDWEGCKFDKDKLEILSQINEFNTKKFDNKYFEQFVITSNKKPVGMISLLEQNRDEVSVNVFIHQEFRRKGIATKSYSLIEKVAKDKGYKVLYAIVNEENKASINLHLKVGFLKSSIISNHNQKQIKFMKQL